jgi:hypothetical protein
MSIYKLLSTYVFHNNGIQKINFEEVQYAIQNKTSVYIINTLNPNEQSCLIMNTISIFDEENIINGLLDNNEINVNIIVYGKNSTDHNAEKKYRQLVQLGFKNVKLYSGGLFEWLLLQDIYDEQNFPTTKKVLDFLYYK